MTFIAYGEYNLAGKNFFLKRKDEDWGDQYVDITATEEIADKAVIQIQVGTTTYPSLCLI